MNKRKILILGVTASGKSRLAFDLAKYLNSEVVSIDSMKVYRQMDIGTAKPSIERREEVKYHLIDVVDPWESFSVSQFLELKDLAVEEIQSKGKTVVAAGGTAMYIKNMLYGLFDGAGSDPDIREELRARLELEGHAKLHRELSEIDPAAAEKIHPNDAKRIIRALEVYKVTGRPISGFQTQFCAPEPDPSWIVIGVRRAKEVESRRINARVRKMVEMGLVDEARKLLELERPLSKQARVAIGYAELFEYFEGKMTLEKSIEKIKINTRRLAKSQRTWFKTFKSVNWLEFDEDSSAEEMLERTVKVLEL